MSRVRVWPYRMHCPFVRSPFMSTWLVSATGSSWLRAKLPSSVYLLTPRDVPLQVCRGHAVDQQDASLYVRKKRMSLYDAGEIQSKTVRRTRRPEMYLAGLQSQKR
jgi:hypothetical protein